ncbi:relaxin-3 [Protopterus annectens]|uniref:relaxin-3 n=1 Tax=Protopterus annectens TaxID=7888 RepID=UPI001CF970E2|nr:relaxin-3 [Protopterus annectens]
MTKLLLVLALWLLAGELQHSSEARAPSYGVKLCGREFIRAVIFTCGGSRWRRASSSLTDGLADFVSSTDREPDEESAEKWNTNLVPGLSFKDYPDYELHSWNDYMTELMGMSRQSRPSRTISDDVLGSLRKQDRTGREAVIGLSNACCRVGCSKSEISSLC